MKQESFMLTRHFLTIHSVNSIIYMNGAGNNKCENRKKAGQR